MALAVAPGRPVFRFFAGSAASGGHDWAGVLTISAVPEPQSWALLLGGMAAVAGLARRCGAVLWREACPRQGLIAASHPLTGGRPDAQLLAFA